jgi:hypothetical protein
MPERLPLDAPFGPARSAAIRMIDSSLEGKVVSDIPRHVKYRTMKSEEVSKGLQTAFMSNFAVNLLSRALDVPSWPVISIARGMCQTIALNRQYTREHIP